MLSWPGNFPIWHTDFRFCLIFCASQKVNYKLETPSHGRYLHYMTHDRCGVSNQVRITVLLLGGLSGDRMDPFYSQRVSYAKRVSMVWCHIIELTHINPLRWNVVSLMSTAWGKYSDMPFSASPALCGLSRSIYGTAFYVWHMFRYYDFILYWKCHHVYTITTLPHLLQSCNCVILKNIWRDVTYFISCSDYSTCYCFA